MSEPISPVHTLTFDAFGTILDLGTSHAPRLAAYLASVSAPPDLTPAALWSRWRYRQRIEQYQDNHFADGHHGYLDSSRRALLYVLRTLKLPHDPPAVARIMEGWQELVCFPDALPGLERLRTEGRGGKGLKLVILSNGERDFLAHLVRDRMRGRGFDFDAVISVQDVGQFKPAPSVYRYAARRLAAEPGELMMVSSHSFDVVGARVSGYRGAYVNRYDLPFDESPYLPDVEVRDFSELAEKLRGI